MQCPSCMFENPEGMRFCGRCGAELAEKCPQCGFQSPPGFQFCGRCGASLKAAGPPEAERRQLTVMFCDLVGSTPLSERLDPEELREVVQAYQEACAGVIGRFGGHIARYLGDGLLVYFGYPRAHEDDARRAVRAGLGIVEGMPQLNARLQPTVRVLREWPLQVRIGIHTGLVVVGEMGGGGYRDPMAVMGDTPNLAARVQGIAGPDTVVISWATHRLIEGLFECQDLGSHDLKGVSVPLQVYRVLGESGVWSRFEVALSRGLVPLVGREKEVGLLLERWERVKAGQGQGVLLNGEAGIGKSRLVQVLKERIAGEPHTRLECRGSPYHQNSPLYPVIDLLQRVFGLGWADSPAEKLQKLEGDLEPYGLARPEAVGLLSSLLSLPLPEGYPPLTLTPQRQRQKTLETVLAMLLQVAGQQPTLLVMEDLHWVDPSTLELLALLLDQVPTARLLVLLVFRPDFRPPWPPYSYLAPLTLTRLSPEQGEAMITRVAGGKSLPLEVLRQLVVKTDGVPLFVEELTRMVLESGLLREQEGRYELTGPLPPLAIPATLHDSLMARLDRLSPVREVAQWGATLGREFSHELIRAVWPADEAGLQQALAQLAAAEVLYQRGLPPQARYLFKHALIQDAAYQSMLRSKRQQVHRQVAQVLEERFPETVEAQPELLAHHHTEAGLVAQAVPYWQKAGQRAAQRSAYLEAVGHLTQGLELLHALPDSPERIQHELMLQTTLGITLIVTKGYAAPEVKQAYARALELCRQVGETPQLFPVLYGLLRFYYHRAELQTARELGEQLLRLARSISDPALLLCAHAALGGTLVHCGELTPALTHLEQSIALYDPQRDRPDQSPMAAHDPKVMCLSYAAWALWSLGYPDLARKRSHEALTLSQELSHPFSRALALYFAASLHLLLREVETVQERAEALITLSHEQGFPLWLAAGAVLQGWVLARQGQAKAGIAGLHQGIAAMRAMGGEQERPRFLALLAEAYREAGQPDEGLGLLAEALAEVQKRGGRFYEAELYRLQGELLLTLSAGNEAEAEACFHQALDIARRQSARSWELRAAMSLSRLWQGQGRREGARQMLAEVYGGFTEGFDTADLREARALLEELIGSPNPFIDMDCRQRTKR